MAAFERSPEGMERLRDLIIEMATSGRLRTSDAADTPAARLVAKAEAFLGGQERRLQTGIEPAPFPLPGGWVWSQPQELGVVSPRNSATDEERVGFLPMAAVPVDYRQGYSPEVRRWGDIKKGYTHFADGDVAVAKITPCFQNKKSCVLKGLPSGIGAGTTELHVLRPVPGVVDPKYLLLFFKSPMFVSGGVARMTGTAGQQRVPVEYFASAPLPLPPLAEQKRIVAKVDQLMALCDELKAKQAKKRKAEERLTAATLERIAKAETVAELRESWGQAANNFARLIDRADSVSALRSTLLDLAMRGRLVPQLSQEGSAIDGLLACQKHRKRVVAEGGFRRILGDSLDVVEPLFSVPESWVWTRLGELLIIVRGASPRPKGDSRFWTSTRTPYHWIKISDFRKHGRDGVLHDTGEFLTEQGTKHSVFAPKGSLVLTNSGTIGVPMFLGIDGFVHDGFLVFPEFPTEHLDQRFVFFMLQSMTHRLKRDARGLAQLNLNTEIVRNAAIALPPLAEQKRIVAKLNQFMSLCDDLESKLRVRDENAAMLAEALVVHVTRA